MERSRVLGASVALSILLMASAAAGQTRAAQLRLEPGDGVRVAVRDEPTLSGDYPVVESGQVLLPEIGLISVAGRPFDDVAREVRAAYDRILVGREAVLVPLLRIAVLGEVQEPGLFLVDPTQTIGDVLALAGGLTSTGSPGRINLVRGGQTMRLELLPDDGPLVARLASGDQIFVGQRSWLRENLPIVLGAGASVLAAALTGLIVR